MSAQEVIERIKELAPQERAEVARFIVENDESWIPDSFKRGMAEAETGRLVETEKVFGGDPPPSRQRQ